MTALYKHQTVDDDDDDGHSFLVQINNALYLIAVVGIWEIPADHTH